MNKSRMDVPEGESEGLRRRARQDSVGHERTTAPVAEVRRPDPVPGVWVAAHRAMESAERYMEVGEQLPPMTALTGWRRRLAVPVARAILRAAKLFTRDQRSFNVESMTAMRAVGSAAAEQADELEKRLAETRGTHDAALARLTEEVARQRESLEARLDTLQRAVAEAVTAAEQRASALEQAAGAARAEAAANLDAIARQLRDDAARLRTQLTLQERSLRAVLERGQAAGSGVAAEERGHLLDDFYVAFEDRFRGSRDEIKGRVTAYLPAVREAGAGTADRPVVDLGCGRGEWLEVLAAEGLHARGVDTNRLMIEENRRHGRDVIEGDALAYLRGLPDASCGAVSALHLLEHLPFETLVALIDEIVRVLKPGGIAILETPNPQNLLVGACSFYVDPTHRNPLHPATLAFVAEARGLARIEVRYLHPAAERFRLPDDASALAKPLNEYLFGPMDFAVIGHRA